MKAKVPTPYHSIVGAVLLLAVGAPAQNLLVGNEINNAVIEITPTGEQSTYAQNMWQVYGLAFDHTGNLYAGLVGGIVRVTPGGAQTYICYDAPWGIALNSAGNIFGADYNGGNIFEYTPTGARSTFASGLNHPTDLAFDSAGNLFVASQGGNDIIEIAPNGMQSIFASGMNNPTGLAFDSAGNLFVGNTGSADIIKITPSGTQSIFTSGGELNAPFGMAFDLAGDLFVANHYGNTITKISPSGVQSLFASGIGLPTGLAFQGETLPVPEPSVFGLLAAGAAAYLGCRGRKARREGGVSNLP